MHVAGLGRSGLAGWLDSREVWDGSDVIVRMIFVILQEKRRVFVGVPRARLLCREGVREGKNVREYACRSGS